SDVCSSDLEPCHSSDAPSHPASGALMAQGSLHRKITRHAMTICSNAFLAALSMVKPDQPGRECAERHASAARPAQKSPDPLWKATDTHRPLDVAAMIASPKQTSVARPSHNATARQSLSTA